MCNDVIVNVERSVYYIKDGEIYKFIGFTPRGIVVINDNGKQKELIMGVNEINDFKQNCYPKEFAIGSQKYHTLSLQDQVIYKSDTLKLHKYITSLIGDWNRYLAEARTESKKYEEENLNRLISIIDNKDYDNTEIKSLCCSLFITPTGKANYDNIDKFTDKVNHSVIYPGDKDSFGWLTGVLNVNGEDICVFG